MTSNNMYVTTAKYCDILTSISEKNKFTFDMLKFITLEKSVHFCYLLQNYTTKINKYGTEATSQLFSVSNELQ